MFGGVNIYANDKSIRIGISAMMASVSVLRRSIAPCVRHRGFMSTMTVASPEEESHFLLILGKPGGGKGTISKKILKVSIGFDAL